MGSESFPVFKRSNIKLSYVLKAVECVGCGKINVPASATLLGRLLKFFTAQL